MLVTAIIILKYIVFSGSVSLKEKCVYVYIYIYLHTHAHVHIWIHLCIYIYVSMYICVYGYMRVTTKEALKVCWSPASLTVAQKSFLDSLKLGTRASFAGTWLCTVCCRPLGLSQYSLSNITDLSFILPLCWSQAERLMELVAVVTLCKYLSQTGTPETQYSFSFSKAQTSPIQLLNYSG